MGRTVKCFATGEFGDANCFIKVEGHYYKSREVYVQYRHEIDCHDRAIEMLCKNILKYQEGQPVPSLVFKKYKELSNFYSNDIILKTIKKQYDTLLYYANHKQFKDAAGKILYIFAIINNAIGDIYKAENEKKELQAKEKAKNDNFKVVAENMNAGSKTELPPGRLSQRNISQFIDEGALV